MADEQPPVLSPDQALSTPPPIPPDVMPQAPPPMQESLGVPSSIQQQQAQVARPGLPIIIKLISDIRNAGQPGHPATRTEGFESFLGNFINALGQGFANAGTGPASFSRGFGSALTAPLRNEMQAQTFGAQQAQTAAETQRLQSGTELTQAQTAIAGMRIPMIGPDGNPVMVNGKPIMIPASQGLQYSGQLMKGAGAALLKPQDPINSLLSQSSEAYAQGDSVRGKALLDQAHQMANAKKADGPAKTPNEIELIQRAQGGDAEAAKTLGILQKRRVELAAARGQAFGMFRLYTMQDPETGQIQPMFGKDIMTAQAQGRQLIPSGTIPANLTINLQRLGAEAVPAMAEVNKHLGVYDNAKDRAIFARVIRDNPMGEGMDPSTWMGNIINQVGKENLSAEGQQLLPRLTRLNETVSLLRSTLGLPATNAAMALTLQMLPGASTPNSAYAREQMKQLGQIITQAGAVPALGGGGANPAPLGRGGKVTADDMLKKYPPVR